MAGSASQYDWAMGGELVVIFQAINIIFWKF